MTSPRKDAVVPLRKRPPATSPEARELQIVSMAYDAVEEQIRAGTASSQVLTHFLKVGSSRDSLEKLKLQSENELLKARVESLANSEDNNDLYRKALNAMTAYKGEDPEVEDLD